MGCERVRVCVNVTVSVSGAGEGGWPGGAPRAVAAFARYDANTRSITCGRPSTRLANVLADNDIRDR